MSFSRPGLFQCRFHAKTQSAPRSQRGTPPAPPQPRRGGRCLEFPSLDMEGTEGIDFPPVLCFHIHSGFVPPFFAINNPVSRQDAKCAKVAKGHHPLPLLNRGGESGAWNSPPCTRRGQGRSIFQPVLCFHIHSGFVPPFSRSTKGFGDAGSPGWGAKKHFACLSPGRTGLVVSLQP